MPKSEDLVYKCQRAHVAALQRVAAVATKERRRVAAGSCRRGLSTFFLFSRTMLHQIRPRSVCVRVCVRMHVYMSVRVCTCIFCVFFVSLCKIHWSRERAQMTARNSDIYMYAYMYKMVYCSVLQCVTGC